MAWLIFLFVSAGLGTAAMELVIRMGVNVWLSRAVGAVVAAVVGIIFYFFLKKKNKK